MLLNLVWASKLQKMLVTKGKIITLNMISASAFHLGMPVVRQSMKLCFVSNLMVCNPLFFTYFFIFTYA